MYHPLGFSLGIIFGDMCFYPSVLIHYRTPIPLEIAVDLKLICHKKYSAMQQEWNITARSSESQ